MSFRLTAAAERDIERILQDTLEMFGPKQVQSYSKLIELALDRIGRAPDGPGVVDRHAVTAGARSLHLDSVAGRRGAAAHLIYFYPPTEHEPSPVILRVLHHRMEPQDRLSSIHPA